MSEHSDQAYKTFGLTSDDRQLLIEGAYDKVERNFTLYNVLKPAYAAGEQRLTDLENVALLVDGIVEKFSQSTQLLNKYVENPVPTLAAMATDGIFSARLVRAISRGIEHFRSITIGEYYKTHPEQMPERLLEEDTKLWPLLDNSIKGIKISSGFKTALELIVISELYGLSNGFAKCLPEQLRPAQDWKIAADT